MSASTEEPLGSVPEANEADVDRAVAAARAAFDAPDGWATWEPARRAAAMRSLADQLAARAPEMAHRVSSQNGMPISVAGPLEGGFPVDLVRYYASLAETLPTEEERPGFRGGTTVVVGGGRPSAQDHHKGKLVKSAVCESGVVAGQSDYWVRRDSGYRL